MTTEELKFKEKLELLIKKAPVSVLAKEFGISRQAFYKWLKKYNIDYSNIPRKKTVQNVDHLNEIADKLLNK